MYLKQIEVENFKSFGKKLTIPMLNGFTAVTGPNGSGKSNISDAILFVLGPKSSKALRAGKLSDLIFNGGNAKQPASYTRVSLVFDNSDRMIPFETDIVKLTRYVKLSESGDGYNSYFYVNDKKSTLGEFDYLLSSARISADGYNLVQQGDVTRIVEMSTLERRRVLDDISGISKFDEEIIKAEGEKKAAEDNIERISIILGELDKQIKQLEQERTSALKYLETRDRLALAKARLAHKRKESAEIEIKGINEQIEGYRQEIASLKVRREEVEKRIAALDLSAASVDEEIRKKGGDEVLDLKDRMDKLKVEVARASDQKERCDDTVLELQGNIQEMEEERIAVAEEKGRLEGQLKRLMAASSSKDKELNELKARQASLQDELSSFDDELSELERKAKEMDNRIREASERQHSLLLEKQRAEDRISRLAQDMVSLQESKDQAEFEVKDLDWRIKDLGKQGKDSSGSLRAQQEKLYSKKNEERKLSQLAQELEQSIKALTREYNHLRAEEEAATNLAKGYTRAVRSLLDARDRGEIKGIHGTIADLAEVNPDYEVALNIAAGARMQSVVVEDDEVAAMAINHLKRNNLGRATFLPLNKMLDGKPRGKALLAEKQAVGFAIDLINFEERYRPAFWYVFGDTVVVDNLDQARRLMGGVRLVTAGGELIEASGAMVGGTVETGKLKFGSAKGKAEEIGEELRKATDQADKIAIELRALKEELIELESNVRELSGSGSQTEIVVDGLQKQLKEQKARLQKATDELAAADSEKRKAEEQIKDLSGKLLSQEGSLTQQKGEREKLAARINEIAPAELSQKLREAQAKVVEHSTELSELASEKAGLNAQKDMAERRLKELDENIGEDKGRIDDVQEQGRLAAENESKLKVELSALRKIEDSMSREISDLRERKEKVLLERANAMAEKEKVITKTETSNDFMIGLTTKLSVAEDRLKELSIEIQQHKVIISHPMPSLDDIKSEITICENSLAAMGAVNLRAIDDYEEKKARHVELRTETKRLEDQRADLIRLTGDLNQKKKSNLAKVFDGVNINFKRIYAELSGGGEAELLLENPAEPFLGGLVIKARPRNGKVLRLEALSGGEKSLTALAFIFALQVWQPSPFYLLDEVDMFLDAVNADMVAQRVKKSSATAQFVQISLRKVTLNKADHIIGVTKPEGGISNVIFKPNIGDIGELEKVIELPEERSERDGI